MQNLYIRLGPPGTGKTYTARGDIVRAAREHDPARIWVGSHTRAAARVLVERDLPLPERNIGTVHALAYRAIGGADIAETHWKDFSKDGNVKTDIDDWAPDEPDSNSNDSAALSEFSLLRSRLVPPDSWPVYVQQFAERWVQFKRDNDYVDFNDLLELAYESSNGPNIVFIDEAQDMTPLQWRLVRKWGSEALFFILYGDDDQAIYEWAGASADHLIRPETDHVRVLEQSTRVPRAVHRVAEGVIRRIGNRQDKTYYPRDCEGTCGNISAHWRDPDWLVRDVEKYITNNENKTCMIISSCSYHLEPTKKLLKENAIPFCNPYRVKRGDWNPLRQSVMDRLLLMVDYDVDYGLTVEQWWSLVEHVRADWFSGRGRKSELKRLANQNKYKRLTMVDMIEYIRPNVLEWIVDAEFDRYRSTLTDAASRSLEFPARVLQKRGNVIPRVILGTIHSVKGGEADRVYVMPDISNKAMENVSRGEMDPITRLFYVGITRAREDLLICAPADRRFFQIG